jgi:hypothetical protein
LPTCVPGGSCLTGRKRVRSSFSTPGKRLRRSTLPVEAHAGHSEEMARPRGFEPLLPP